MQSENQFLNKYMYVYVELPKVTAMEDLYLKKIGNNI